MVLFGNELWGTLSKIKKILRCEGCQVDDAIDNACENCSCPESETKAAPVVDKTRILISKRRSHVNYLKKVIFKSTLVVKNTLKKGHNKNVLKIRSKYNL